MKKNYRLISRAGTEFWKQDPETKSHTLTFRPDAPEDSMGMAGAMSGGDVVSSQVTAAEAASYELGGLYAVEIGPAVAEQQA